MRYKTIFIVAVLLLIVMLLITIKIQADTIEMLRDDTYMSFELNYAPQGLKQACEGGYE